jgi:hypothetical protein
MDGTEVEVALLDPDGVIVSANQAWFDFCLDNGGDIARCGDPIRTGRPPRRPR